MLSALEQRGAIMVVDSVEQAIDLSNLFAPEHLCLQVEDPWTWVGRVTASGGIFVGETSPEVLGDYTALGIYVDRVRDHACNPDEELLWQQSTGPMSAWGPHFTESDAGGIVWAVTPDTLRVFEEAGPCNVNGMFDLTIPLRCPPGS